MGCYIDRNVQRGLLRDLYSFRSVSVDECFKLSGKQLLHEVECTGRQRPAGGDSAVQSVPR